MKTSHHPRPRRAGSTVTAGTPTGLKRGILARLAIATAMLAVPLAAGLGTAAPASAGTLARPALASTSLASAGTAARLTIANASDPTADGYRWQVSGSWYPYGRSDVQLWVYDITSLSTIASGPVEYQGGLHTTARCLTICVLGGAFLSAEGAASYMPPEGIVGGYWVPLHPLQCGHTYAAYTQDPVDGEVGSNTLTEPACQGPPR